MYTKNFVILILAGILVGSVHVSESLFSVAAGDFKDAILPELPGQVPIRPVSIVVDRQDDPFGWWAGQISYDGTIYGLDQMTNNVTYDCETNVARFSMLVPNLEMEGRFAVQALAVPIGSEVTVEGPGNFQLSQQEILVLVMGQLNDTTDSLFMDNPQILPALPLTTESTQNLTIYWDGRLVEDQAEREYVVQVFKEGFWGRIQIEAESYLADSINGFLSKFTLDDFATAAGAVC